MTPIVKLVFGADHDKTRLTEFAEVLGHAARNGIAIGALEDYLADHPGGIKGIVTAERAARRPVRPPIVQPSLADRAVMARVDLDVEVAEGDLVILVARGGVAGTLEIVGATLDARLVAGAARAIG